MILIEKLGTKKNKSGNYISFGLFLCLVCLQIVERGLRAGKRQISCGCIHGELISKANKGKKRTEKERYRLSNINKGRKHTQEHNINISESKKGITLSEEHRQKIREAHIGKNQTEETKLKISKATKGENNPNYGKIGELSSQWQNGQSFEIYPKEFNKELKNFILERDEYKCQCPDCNILKEMDLHVHHIDYNKNNNNPDNLIILCNSCHMKTNNKNKRKYFTEFYQNIMMGKVIECLL